MRVEIKRGSKRFVERKRGQRTRHSFSFGADYDPERLEFGPMICHNDDSLAPGGGYPDHPHADLEIVTWVLDGVLLHTDDAGNTDELRPGDPVAVPIEQGAGLLLGEVIGDYLFQGRELLPHRRPARWDRVVPRSAARPPATLQDPRALFSVVLDPAVTRPARH